MSGTFYSIPGLRSITRRDDSLGFRLATFGVILILGAALFLWIKAGAGRLVQQLHREFESIEAGRFLETVHLSSSILDLNDTVLAGLLYEEVTNRDSFLRQAAELRQKIAANGRHLTRAAELEAFRSFQSAFERYYARAEQQLKENSRSGAKSFRELHQNLNQQTRPVMAALDGLITAQNNAFELLVAHSEGAMVRLQLLLQLSVVLLLVLAVALVVLGYRGLISPLRARLHESRTIIGRQEKLASLGVLAAGVAHEIRNPLTAIKFRLFSLNKALPQIAGQEDAKVISAEINRLDRIVTDFLQFARPSEPKLIAMPAERIVQQVRNLLESDLEKRGIQLQTDLSRNIWIKADAQQLEQVLINLIQNAADSIGRDGTVTVTVREELPSRAGKGPAMAVLEITDTGKGIAPEVEKRLFDPFFTTKDAGTGLGLAIAARIVEKHGGLLRYRRRFNVGATFEILLPKENAA